MLPKRVAKAVSFFLISALMCGMFGAFSAAAANEGINVGAGIVKVDELLLRTKPSNDTDSYKITGARKDEYVVIVKWANAEWYEVIYNGKRGFMKASYIAPTDSMNYYVGIGEIVGEDVRLREAPDYNSNTLKTLALDTTVKITGVNTEWYKVEYGELIGYVRSDYIRVVFMEQSSGVNSPIIGAKDVVTPLIQAANVKNVSYTDSTGELSFDSSTTTGKLADYAMSLLGVKYVYAASTPEKGFDCSGFVMHVWGQYGVSLPHGATSQSSKGTKVEKDQLKTGDIVFFGPGGGINHSGIYLGDGVFIHASSAGECVKLNNLSDSYYLKNYRGAVRVY